MMQPVKNKGVTYLLIGAVAVVWGIIIYRVFFMDPLEDGRDSFLKANITHEPFDQYEVKEDTSILALNYRDPFLSKSSAPVEVPKSGLDVHPVQGTIKALAPPINWNIIKYSGYITNPRTKRLVSILTVNGKERMVAEGESLEGVKLLKNKRDSVLVSWMGKQKYIKQ
jgi:hypothetical protein